MRMIDRFRDGAKRSLLKFFLRHEGGTRAVRKYARLSRLQKDGCQPNWSQLIDTRARIRRGANGLLWACVIFAVFMVFAIIYVLWP